MHIKSRKKADILILSVSGEVNVNTVFELKKAFKKIIEESPRKVLLNFSELDYIDSSGLASLIEFSKELGAIGAVMFISDIPVKISSVFSITKLDTMFKIFETESKALEEFKEAKYG